MRPNDRLKIVESISKEQKKQVFELLRKAIDEKALVSMSWALGQVSGSLLYSSRLVLQLVHEFCASNEYIFHDAQRSKNDWDICKNPTYVKKGWIETNPVRWAIIQWIGTAVIAAIVGYCTPSKQEKTSPERPRKQAGILPSLPTRSLDVPSDSSKSLSDSLDVPYHKDTK